MSEEKEEFKEDIMNMSETGKNLPAPSNFLSSNDTLIDSEHHISSSV